jgi:hypothetical protein
MHIVRVHHVIPYGYPTVLASQTQASQWLGDVIYSNGRQIWEVIAEVQVNGPPK